MRLTSSKETFSDPTFNLGLEGFSFEHLPSENFSANGAGLASGSITHNVLHWFALLCQITKPGKLTVSQTI
ncbi:MAG: hypothetical protein M0Z96_00790 [Actinomycetota bacterium]|nr:hypothetical protein [Actinomycetota bacterium]